MFERKSFAFDIGLTAYMPYAPERLIPVLCLPVLFRARTNSGAALVENPLGSH